MNDDFERRLQRLESLHLEKRRSGVAKFAALEKLLLPASIAALGFFANQASNKIQAGQLALAQAQEQRQAQEAQMAINLRYLDLVYADLKSSDPKIQIKALGFLIGVEPEYGLMLATAVANNPGTSEQVKDQATRVVRNIKRYGELVSYEIGIFFDDSSGSLMDMATALEIQFQQDRFPSSVRQHPRSAAQMRELGLAKENQIRYEEPFERDAAERLQWLLSMFHPEGSYRLIPVSSPTPRFISIFLVEPGEIPGTDSLML